MESKSCLRGQVNSIAGGDTMVRRRQLCKLVTDGLATVIMISMGTDAQRRQPAGLLPSNLGCAKTRSASLLRVERQREFNRMTNTAESNAQPKRSLFIGLGSKLRVTGELSKKQLDVWYRERGQWALLARAGQRGRHPAASNKSPSRPVSRPSTERDGHAGRRSAN